MRKPTTVMAAVLTASVVGALGFAIAALASTDSPRAVAAETSETSEETTEQATVTKFAAALSARAEVPKAVGVPANAGGALKLDLKQDHGDYSISWTLTYRSLSGKALAAHIHKGAPGKAGPVLVALCGPCKTGQTGKAPVAKTVAAALKAKLAYVNVHTAKNKNGELRGQLR